MCFDQFSSLWLTNPASNSNSNGNTATHALLKRIRQLELELSAKERQLVKKVG